MGRLVNNKVKFLRDVRERLEVGLEYVAAKAAELHRSDLDEEFPPASQPGEFPARRTGNLQDSVIHVLDAGQLVSHFGYAAGQAPYFVFLAQAGRLGPIATVIEHKQDLEDAFYQGAAAAGSF